MNFIETIEDGGFGVLRAFFFLLPRVFCLRIGEALGLLAFHLDKKHQAVALANLKMAMGQTKPYREIYRIARSSFIHFGRMLAEVIKLPQLSEARVRRLITVEGEEHIQKALSLGKGALIFSAHFGNWEIASAVISGLGKLNVVARLLDNAFLEEEIVRFRTKLGARVIPKLHAAKPILVSLRKNEMVAILIDQNVLRSQAVFVDFFGREAATTPSLASFFLRTKAPLIPVFCTPTAAFTYHLKIGGPVEIPLEGDFEQDVLKITEHCTKIIENEIRQNPDVWLWFHNRWKTRPESEGSGPDI